MRVIADCANLNQPIQKSAFLPIDLYVLIEDIVYSAGLDDWFIKDLNLLFMKLGLENISRRCSDLALPSYNFNKTGIFETE